MIPDVRDLINDFYDDGSITSMIIMIGPLLEYFRLCERAGKIALICSKEGIFLMKMFPDGDMCVM